MDMTKASSRTLDNLRRHCVYRGVLATMVERRWYYRRAHNMVRHACCGAYGSPGPHECAKPWSGRYE